MDHRSGLNHPRRRRLFEYIRSHPGIHLRAISRSQSMELGVLRLHLRVLRRAGLVHSRRSGRRRIYFAREYRGTAGASRRELLLEEIHRHRGVSPTELAARSGVSRMLVNYHVQRLRRSGEVRAEREGRRVRLYPPAPFRGAGPGVSRLRPPRP